jgi:hypothetical protein
MPLSTALTLYFAIGLSLFSLTNTQAQMINTKQSILESSGLTYTSFGPSTSTSTGRGPAASIRAAPTARTTPLPNVPEPERLGTGQHYACLDGLAVRI